MVLGVQKWPRLGSIQCFVKCFLDWSVNQLTWLTSELWTLTSLWQYNLITQAAYVWAEALYFWIGIYVTPLYHGFSPCTLQGSSQNICSIPKESWTAHLTWRYSDFTQSCNCFQESSSMLPGKRVSWREMEDKDNVPAGLGLSSGSLMVLQ